MYLHDTPKPKSEEEAITVSKGRDAIYMKEGFSKSTIDHFFDKLIHITLPKEMDHGFIKDFYMKKQK